MSKRDVGLQRLDVFLRLVALILLLLGLAIFFMTVATPLNPALAALFYLVSLMLMGTGLLVLIARFA